MDPQHHRELVCGTGIDRCPHVEVEALLAHRHSRNSVDVVKHRCVYTVWSERTSIPHTHPRFLRHGRLPSQRSDRVLGVLYPWVCWQSSFGKCEAQPLVISNWFWEFEAPCFKTNSANLSCCGRCNCHKKRKTLVLATNHSNHPSRQDGYLVQLAFSQSGTHSHTP